MDWKAENNQQVEFDDDNKGLKQMASLKGGQIEIV